eukprot:6186438-Pleurochrysis_carterae.AAC.1
MPAQGRTAAHWNQVRAQRVDTREEVCLKYERSAPETRDPRNRAISRHQLRAAVHAADGDTPGTQPGRWREWLACEMCCVLSLYCVLGSLQPSPCEAA